MKQYNFTKEEMNFIIDGLKEVCSNPNIIKENFLAAENTLLCNGDCDIEFSCAECIKFKFKAFLDIVKDVFVNNVPPVQTEPKEKKLHKYRLLSYGESFDWIEITDEQIRLLEYLKNNELLSDEFDFKECENTNFKRI